jgi:hypothetical protein
VVGIELPERLEVAHAGLGPAAAPAEHVERYVRRGRVS